MTWISSLASTGLLLVFAGCFGALALNLLDRLAVVGIGALTTVLLGTVFQFYSPADAAGFVWGKGDTLVLLGGIGVVTGILAEFGEPELDPSLLRQVFDGLDEGIGNPSSSASGKTSAIIPYSSHNPVHTISH